MNRPPGFADINMRFAGSLLLILGIACLAAVGVASVTGWYAVPSSLIYFALAAVLLGLYLVLSIARRAE